MPGSGRQLLAKNATLQLCDDTACKPTKVTVTVKLDASPDSSNKCEVDADSIAARNHFCGRLEMSCYSVTSYCLNHLLVETLESNHAFHCFTLATLNSLPEILTDSYSLGTLSTLCKDIFVLTSICN